MSSTQLGFISIGGFRLPIEKMDVPFTRIPNDLIRSKKLNSYDMRVYCCIASCGDNAFPGYKTLMEWGGMSRDRVWKSIQKLKKMKVIYQYKKKRGEKAYYATHWTELKKMPGGYEVVRVADQGSPCDGPLQVNSGPCGGPYKESSYKDLSIKNVLADAFKKMPQAEKQR